MIKKFKEYIKESRDVTREDIEDNLLWLKEILGCHIIFNERNTTAPYPFYGSDSAIILVPENAEKDRINKEREIITKRLQNMFPDYQFIMSYKRMLHDETYLYNFYHHVWNKGKEIYFKAHLDYLDYMADNFGNLSKIIELKWKRK